MKTLNQKQLEFLDETVAFYSEDVKERRAVDEKVQELHDDHIFLEYKRVVRKRDIRI